jgi:hypothetical protein
MTQNCFDPWQCCIEVKFVEFISDEKKIDQIKLVAVAAKEPEKSSEDNTLLYVESA